MGHKILGLEGSLKLGFTFPLSSSGRLPSRVFREAVIFPLNYPSYGKLDKLFKNTYMKLVAQDKFKTESCLLYIYYWLEQHLL